MNIGKINGEGGRGLEPDFQSKLKKFNIVVHPSSIDTIWVNITRACNQSCNHCHVDASPERREYMTKPLVDRCLDLLELNPEIKYLDITGGAPELHPDFDYFVVNARKLGKNVKVRHNLTIIIDGNSLTGETKEYLPELFAENRVEVIASLPHYTRAVTDANRGSGVFDKSIEAIRRLNALGYGKRGTDLVLNLVHNSDGPVSPKDRENMESAFRSSLSSDYGLVFNSLLCVTNVPINRFYLKLRQSNSYDEYMNKLIFAFNPASASNLVCKSLISIDYKGNIYDCDFNQMLDLQVCDPEPANVNNFNLNKLLNRQIQFGPHCFGCTAGGGSS